MFKEVKSFLVSNIACLVIFGTAAISQGCVGVTDPDPGVCTTTADFPLTQVSESYGDMVCGDWVKLLISNCVQIESLPINPTEFEIGTYCAKMGSSYSDPNGNGNTNRYTFTIEHTCNFIDNPSYECSQYGSTSQPLAEAKFDSEFKAKISSQIDASPRMKATASKTTLNYGRDQINAADLSVKFW